MKVIILKQGVHVDLEFDSKTVSSRCKEICSSVVLLKAESPEEKNIIVDTGNLGYEDEILANLEKQGVKPEDINYVINTHSHFDHITNNYLFKNADRVIGATVWYTDKGQIGYNDLDLIKVPGIKMIKTPGHAATHTSVVVENQGKTHVIAGDAIQEERIKKGLQKSNKIYMDSAKKILDMADVIIPGHGRIIEGEDLEQLKKAVNQQEV
ncbi:MBL fold metallo-hydrolase [Candidatus Woesearchaeota archaeon]|nr:MBL fold metallo-hydrolase [Candidatus Woesearchaeota archaeon]